MLTCRNNLIQQLDTFLNKELSAELSKSKWRKSFSVTVINTLKRDDFYYTFIRPDSRLSQNFEDMTWVEIKSGGSSHYGSLWIADEKKPYLLLGSHISPGIVQIKEADSIKLLDMQKKAVCALKEGNNSHSNL